MDYEIKKLEGMFCVLAFGKVQFRSAKRANCVDWINKQLEVA